MICKMAVFLFFSSGEFMENCIPKVCSNKYLSVKATLLKNMRTTNEPRFTVEVCASFILNAYIMKFDLLN